MIHVNRFGANVRVHRDGLTDIMTIDNAARLLAGLEVALAAALKETKRGKCLKCGRTDTPWSALRAREPCVAVRCYCGGVLAPVKGRQP